MSESNERLVFSNSVEGLLIRGVGAQLGAASREKFRQLGIDLDRPLLPAYPEKLWKEALELAASEAFPELPAEQGHFKLGESTINGMFETVFGKGLLAMARMLGTRRALLRFPSVAKSGTNFSRISVREHGPNDIEFVNEPYGLRPEFMWGVIHGVIAATGGTAPEVTTVLHDRDAERIILRARWS